MKNDNRLQKESIKQFKNELCAELLANGSITVITRKLVRFIDELLLELFQKHHLHKDNQFCLIALGSYGRRELQLHSDIDLLLLHNDNCSAKKLGQAQIFIQNCWDIGLEISHQITTVEECSNLASRDLSVISTIMDGHLVCGWANLMETLLYKTQALHMWPSPTYFLAKQEEQQKRYAKYGETAYNLEPNVKNGPGGLRDLHILFSIGKRHFHIKKIADGIYSGFITDKEYEELLACQHFLWRIRFALHMLAEKPEDRLLFDYQKKLAEFFGYKDTPSSLAIEQFMKSYFKVIKRSRELNEMVLQWFTEAIIDNPKQRLTPLDDNFQLSNNYIEVRNTRIFKEKPENLLLLFLWIAKNPEIQGVRAGTIRLVRQSLYLITKHFKLSSTATEIFMAIFKAPNPYEALQSMNRHGVLGRYLDCFATVTGQMQYDLFHVYTVDQHTLFVIRNIFRFKNKEFSKTFSLCCQVMPAIKKPEILYLAALFHDIAKGRGGDHSELGALEAKNFSERHRLDQEDCDLLVWLVENHLKMSRVAQQKDIYDPKIINEFCSALPQAYYLDYLYLLTVADICATNPALWNAWKDSLLKELYNAASQALKEEKALLDETSFVMMRKQKAMKILVKDSFSQNKIEQLWANFKERYFLHEQPEIIAYHTKAILSSPAFPVIVIMPHHSQGGTEVLIYMPHNEERFITTTTVLSNCNVSILEASITTCANNFDLDTYIILNEHNEVHFDKERTAEIQKALFKQLSAASKLVPQLSKRRLSRRQSHFKLKPKLVFNEDPGAQRNSLFLIASDRPGLLAGISRIFFNLGIHLHNAKITTAGERVEDMFYITNKEGHMLTKDEKNTLKKEITAALEQAS